MKKLKKKTSRLFKEAPSADERAAAAAGDFDAGVGAPPPVKKKPSFWGLKKAEGRTDSPPPVPAIPAQYLAASGAEERPRTAIQDGGLEEVEVERREKGTEGKPKESLGFAKLKSKGSRFFRSASPVAQPTPTAGIFTISRPLSPSATIPPTPPIDMSTIATLPFHRRQGPPPPRPERPASLDKELVELMRGHGRVVLPPLSARTSSSSSREMEVRGHRWSDESVESVILSPSRRISESGSGSVRACGLPIAPGSGVVDEDISTYPYIGHPAFRSSPSSSSATSPTTTSFTSPYMYNPRHASSARGRGYSSHSNAASPYSASFNPYFSTSSGHGSSSRLASPNPYTYTSAYATRSPTPAPASPPGPWNLAVEGMERYDRTMETKFTVEGSVGKKGGRKGMVIRELGGVLAFVEDI
ncbi:hypothetical protein K458DRAFT_490858 [Lentithecium fluviatile CBS 122367]|uniref:Uncharacterized protein n=1 Tax=Lentithecium fluviatile CBS 122367 TaxID=1168545 RepID=A0A6G1IL75_9PLEO|nr:hypothetical protein K458DRAFT_490858 [Lentithecium fluviatile CBS 122367]